MSSIINHSHYLDNHPQENKNTEHHENYSRIFILNVHYVDDDPAPKSSLDSRNAPSRHFNRTTMDIHVSSIAISNPLTK